MNILKQTLKIVLIVTGSIAFLILMTIGVLEYYMRFPEPVQKGDRINPASLNRMVLGENHFRVNNSWLRKNEYGIWEMYLEGAPYERGVTYGVLAKELMENQEVAFVEQIREMIPNEWMLRYLKYFIAWFNRDIYQYIEEENLQEIYGISHSFSDEFSFIGENYFRILNYHAAHDIGHALVDMNMVGCTSFAVNGPFSADSSLLIGRNFDFNMGDRFSEDKLIVFLNPDKGYKLAYYTWAGFTGVVSGINEKGLTVTLNAAKSKLPFSAKEPISLLAREILQYCATIEEAKTLAAKRQIFVSESLLIGSAAEQSASVIEKSPEKQDVYHLKNNLLVCSNHYQSPAFENDSTNIENMLQSDSKYRFDRMLELINQKIPLNYNEAAEILRDQRGLDDQYLGMGNPKAINQLLAHHAIIFKPESREFWISTQPYQLGVFLHYDLNTVFENAALMDKITSDNFLIPEDNFLKSEDYTRFEQFKISRNALQTSLLTGKSITLSTDQISEFIASNPESYITYQLLGDYFYRKQKKTEAVEYYKKALSKEVASLKEREAILKKMTSLPEALSH